MEVSSFIHGYGIQTIIQNEGEKKASNEFRINAAELKITLIIHQLDYLPMIFQKKMAPDILLDAKESKKKIII
jgi:predicted nucleic acid-binding OB-fold protein